MKEGLRHIAEREHRSLANMIEVMIRGYCADNGVTVPEQKTLFVNAPENSSQTE